MNDDFDARLGFMLCFEKEYFTTAYCAWCMLFTVELAGSSRNEPDSLTNPNFAKVILRSVKSETIEYI